MTVRAKAVWGLVLTMVVACGLQPSGQKNAPVEPPPTRVAVPPLDALAPEPPPVPPPRLACPKGSALAPAPAPEPTWSCLTLDGTRNGPFLTVYPDDTIEISGAYTNGALDGRWSRSSPSGVVLEEGVYAAGQKDGLWTQRMPAGATLGTYTMTKGTGTEKVWYDNGPLYSERALRRGQPHGTAHTYAPDGTLLSVAHYDNGKLDGPHVFGSKLNMRFEETFAHGIRRDQRSIWVQGVLTVEETYDRSGRLDGPYTVWRKKDVMKTTGAFTKGKRTGRWSYFDRGGNKEREGTFLAGKRDGTWQEWWNTKIAWTGEYANGKPSGEFVYFDRNGKELGRSTIKDGTGTMMTFYANRRPATRQYMFQGVPAGIYQELTPLGKVTLEGRYRGDLKQGTWKAWTADGVPTLEQTWKRGKLDGIVRKYIDGKVATEATYKDGKANGPYQELRGGRPALVGQFVAGLRQGTWTTYDAEGSVLLTATYQDGVLDGPWHQLADGTVVEGAMVAGRRSGIWTRTDRGGVVSTLTYAGL